MSIKGAKFVKRVMAYERDNGDPLDAIELEDGNVIVIDGGKVMLYEDIDDLESSNDDDERPGLLL